jgi:replication factor C small subunit
MCSLIDKIAKQEKLTLTDRAKNALIEASSGDIRRLENLLQSVASTGSKISEEDVFTMASLAKPKEILAVLQLSLKGKFLEARKKLLDTMLNYGLAGQDIIKQIQKEILKLDIPDRNKMLLIEKCGEVEFRMTEGSDEYLQLEALLASVALAKN